MDKIDHAGIEVSLEVLLVALRRDGQRLPLKSFPNTTAGHGSLAAYLVRPGRRVRVCMESTGVYGLDLALHLQPQAGIELMVANPRAVRHFAQARMQRSKTDPLDAVMLLEFAARMEFRPWQPPSTTALHLRALARRLEAITELCTAEKNRLHAASAAQAQPAVIRQDLRRSIAFHQRAAERLARQAMKLITADPLLQQRFEELDSVPGIAATAPFPCWPSWPCSRPIWMSGSGWPRRASIPGNTPRAVRCTKKVRISKTGNRHLRRALYMPALVAVQHDPSLRAFYEHLLAKGKFKMQALVAVMRKLLHAIFGMLKHHQPYDGSKVFHLPAQAPTARTSTEKVA